MTCSKGHTQEDGTHPGAYRAFLVRCWQEPDVGNGCPAWRFTLVQLDDKKTERGFAGLDALVEHLRAELAALSVVGDRQGGGSH